MATVAIPQEAQTQVLGHRGETVNGKVAIRRPPTRGRKPLRTHLSNLYSKHNRILIVCGIHHLPLRCRAQRQ